MSQCFVNYPCIPTPKEEILGEGTSRIQIRIDEGPFFMVRSHQKNGKLDRVFPLPAKPSNTPHWRYAITLPGGFKDERGLVFVVGNYWGFWSFDSESQKTWQEQEFIPNKQFLMAALETDPTPFDTFSRELLLADKIVRENTKEVLPKNNWPKGLHTYWLEVLLETNCSKNEETLVSEGRILKSLKMDEETTKKLIENLRRGAIVSMALRAKTELPNAVRIIESTTGKTPKDNKWMSLLELVSF
jgi:hypothetical protein